ncbi:MAG: hypothetical protein ACOX4A_06005 [Saccharofermentanales bacterium]|jgi:hypothetical protein
MMKRIMKQMVVWALILILVGSLAGCGGSEKKPEGVLETFLSKAAGDWYCCGNLEDRKLTINADGTFVIDYDSETTDEGNIDYDEDMELLSFDGQEQGYVCELLDDDTLEFWGWHYYRAEQSIEFGRIYGDWYLDGDTDLDYYAFEDGKWMLMGATDNGHETAGQGYVEYRGTKEYPLQLFENYSDSGEPVVAFRIEGEDELIMEDGGTSYMRIDADDDGSDDEEIDETDETDESDETDEEIDGNNWVIADVEESASGLKFQYPYFANGDVTGGRLFLGEEGGFLTINPASEESYGQYSEDLDAGTVTFTLDDSGESFTAFVEDNGAVLRSEEGDLLICVAAQFLPDKNGEYPDAYYNHPIPPNSYYYQNGDHDSGSLFFYDILGVATTSPDGDVMGAYYSINGDVLQIGWVDVFDGFSLTIEDGGKTLVAENGERFILDE